MGIFWFVYIVKCADSSFYVGITNDLVKRIDEHNQGQGSFYTNVKKPVELVYFEGYRNKFLAAKREKQIKNWRTEKKELLINASLDKLGIKAWYPSG